MYTVTVDRINHVVEAKLEGMMSPAEAADYIAEVKRRIAIDRVRNFAMVIDVSDCPIQSQDLMRAMGAQMATMPKARALAIVTGSSLARMQVRRLFTQPYARIVGTLAEARAWVIHGAEPLAA